MSGDPLADVVSVRDLERRAAERAGGYAYDYLQSGSGDEHTLSWNTQAWAAIRLAPRVLVDVSRIDTSLELLGHHLPHPLLLAPAAQHGLWHEGAEPATAAGAGAAEAVVVASTLAGRALEETAAAATSPWWFQLYVQRDRGVTRDLVRRAADAGATALVLTVDTPVLGARDRDRRGVTGVAEGLSYPNLGSHEPAPDADPVPVHRRVYNPHLDASLTWSVVEWLASISDLPVLCKGVLRPDDAQRAVAHGAAAVIVSNHGARNLDTVPATAHALPRVVDAVAGRVPVLVDGGIRRGTDVAKALCLGATAVLVGRAYLWGLAVAGAAGVTRSVDILRTELEMAMGQLGAPTLARLDGDLLWPPD